jgi:hypothetical protein
MLNQLPSLHCQPLTQLPVIQECDKLLSEILRRVGDKHMLTVGAFDAFYPNSG